MPLCQLEGLEMSESLKHPDRPHTLSVPEAGKTYFNLGRGASYEAARRGDIPTLRIGRKLLVPVQAIERKLAEVGQGN